MITERLRTKKYKKLPFVRTNLGHYLKVGNTVEILYIVDADTFDIKAFINLRDVPNSICPDDDCKVGMEVILNIRLFGIDCREKYDEYGQKAKEYVADLFLLNNNRVTILALPLDKKDKYNRLLARVGLKDENGTFVDLSDHLISKKIDGRSIANPYNGGTKMEFVD